MKKVYILLISLIASGTFISCEDQLDVENPNEPGLTSAQTESGVISLAQGAVYVNGFRDLKYYDGIPGYFWSGAVGFHELMGDVIGEEAANVFGNQIGAPDYIVLDNGTQVLNPNAPNKQKELIKQINLNSNAGSNTLFYEWAYMYSLNNSCNTVLETVEHVSFTGDAEAKKNTIKAWAYFWKGYAYSRIGSMYIAGLINDVSATTNANYVTKEQVIAEASSNFDEAAALLSGLAGNAGYTSTINSLIPAFNQIGHGGALSSDMWIRNINTMKARNILVNTTVQNMTAAQWQEVLELTNNGIKATDYVFTGRANESGDLLSASAGTVSAKTTGNPGQGTTYKISERLIQDFKPGDQRFANNFNQLANPWRGESSRGNAFNTRFELVDGGNGLDGVIILGSKTPGEYELFLAGSYEENELMKAEANIYLGNLEEGLKLIDAVRAYQGAGLAPVAATGLSMEAALEELRRERRIGLLFRGLSFYDARRWGVINDVSQGGGRTGAVVVSSAGQVNTNATINYNFAPYWDVPDNELVYNAPAAGSAPVKVDL